ncbi:hypothetical protein HYO65_gp085 [Tenacibaculum phage PTm1]|uniref:Uncharacterized protein n=2 Tax=Shirahamavirus PTm1 TaxID=2846435 RepID=A0A5S9BZ14_9CAUD|nr:hypothetical protein HYO65_gp085 [Tenacibaculum phage PTm1]BBI90477.1 hypothetical protein [Tenacibaculum phage PTm1]BBI90785.1 hypothetical protein [Tenacibaculum phage PTm5]
MNKLIAVLETTSPSYLHKIIGTNGDSDLLRCSTEPERLFGVATSIPIQSYHVYIVSDCEIKVGDLYINFEDYYTESTRIKTATQKPSGQYCYKLYATSDISVKGVKQLDHSFFEKKINMDEVRQCMTSHNQLK